MNWILDNLEKLVPVVITILYFVGSSKAKKVEDGRRAADPGAEDRSRRIQEDIRRKILERQQEGKPIVRIEPPEEPFVRQPEFEESDDPFEPEFDERRGEQMLYVEEEVSTPAPMSSGPDVLFERQRQQIEEQMQKARDLRNRLPAMHGKLAPTSSRGNGLKGIGDLRMNIRKDLKDANSIRRAIVLKELLDAPLALR
ncbi:MAG: hypothetical protein P8L49_16520 [Opitutaceae bacterium]|nr:hypothetical protein [Opitutaceae bacterium]